MKLLITGHKGFIGSNALKHFSQKYNFTVDGYEWGDEKPKFKKYDWVIHMGAITSTTETDVRLVMKQNYFFTTDLLEECNRHGVNVQFSSSASVYGRGLNFSENAPLDPLTPYAWSKAMVELYIASRQWGIILQTFRYFNVYGPGEDHKGSQASPHHNFTKQAINRGEIVVFNVESKRDFIHVSSVVGVQDKFLNVPISGTWNLGTGYPISFKEIAQSRAKEHDANIKYIPLPEVLKNSYQYYTCADTEKLTNTLDKYTNSIYS